VESQVVFMMSHAYNWLEQAKVYMWRVGCLVSRMNTVDLSNQGFRVEARRVRVGRRVVRRRSRIGRIRPRDLAGYLSEMKSGCKG